MCPNTSERRGGEFVPVEHTGRFWGVIQGQKWVVTKLAFQIGEETFIRYRRVILKMHRRAAKKAMEEARKNGRRKPAWAVKGRDREEYRLGSTGTWIV